MKPSIPLAIPEVPAPVKDEEWQDKNSNEEEDEDNDNVYGWYGLPYGPFGRR
jgi:hypothetical protein